MAFFSLFLLSFSSTVARDSLYWPVFVLDQSPGTLFADVEMEILDVATPRPPKRFRFAGAVAAPGDGFQESFHCGALTRDELRSPPPCAPSADDLGDDDHDWHMELASAPSFGFASRS